MYKDHFCAKKALIDNFDQVVGSPNERLIYECMFLCLGLSDRGTLLLSCLLFVRLFLTAFALTFELSAIETSYLEYMLF